MRQPRHVNEVILFKRILLTGKSIYGLPTVNSLHDNEKTLPIKARLSKKIQELLKVNNIPFPSCFKPHYNSETFLCTYRRSLVKTKMTR